MSVEFDDGQASAPVWASFADLMSVLLGAFVLVLVGALAIQAQLASRLDEVVRQREQEARQRHALEQALAGPLAEGRVTLVDGRIGIGGNVLFALNSDRLQPEGEEVRASNGQFTDNWELSAQRALTVTRSLIDAGVPADAVFAAAFGPQQPVASNDDASGRAKNRRVEIAPMPRPARSPAAADGR